MNLYGKWFLELTVVIKVGNSEDGTDILERNVKIPLTIEASNVVNADRVANIADVLWGQLTRDMIAGYLNFPLVDDDKVSLKGPHLVLEGKPEVKNIRNI